MKQQNRRTCATRSTSAKIKEEVLEEVNINKKQVEGNWANIERIVNAIDLAIEKTAKGIFDDLEKSCWIGYQQSGDIVLSAKKVEELKKKW